MKYRILARQLNDIIKDARYQAKNGGKEVCGFLVYNGYFIELLRLNNKKERGGSFSFYLKEADYYENACKKMGHKIIGTYHSHPLSIARPGESDKAGAYDDEIMLIIDVSRKSVRLWKIVAGKEKELKYVLI